MDSPTGPRGHQEKTTIFGQNFGEDRNAFLTPSRLSTPAIAEVQDSNPPEVAMKLPATLAKEGAGGQTRRGKPGRHVASWGTPVARCPFVWCHQANGQCAAPDIAACIMSVHNWARTQSKSRREVEANVGYIVHVSAFTSCETEAPVNSYQKEGTVRRV